MCADPTEQRHRRTAVATGGCQPAAHAGAYQALVELRSPPGIRGLPSLACAEQHGQHAHLSLPPLHGWRASAPRGPSTPETRIMEDEYRQLRWFHRKRIIVLVVILVALLVIVAIPGSAHELGFVTGTAVRLVYGMFSPVL